jgi:L-threonylcarbamoyladenylate synthase
MRAACSGGDVRTLQFTEPDHGRDAATAVLEVVRRHGVVLVPTDTFYGLAANPASETAVEAVHRLKRRPPEKALPVLCADHQQVASLVDLPERFRVRLGRMWPGPLTVVLPARRPLAACPDGTVAVRIPDHHLLRAVLYRTGPLTGTSANRHGEPPGATAAEAAAGLDGWPDLVLDGGRAVGGLASTVVDLTGPEPRILRQGPVDWEPRIPGVATPPVG